MDKFEKLGLPDHFLLQLDPLFTRGYIRIAKCCVVTGDVAGASHALDQAHKLEPNNLAVTQERNTLQTLQKHQLDSQQAISSGDRRKVIIIYWKWMNYSKVVDLSLIFLNCDFEGFVFPWPSLGDCNRVKPSEASKSRMLGLFRKKCWSSG